MRFGPKSRSEEEIFAIENFRTDLQQVIYAVMQDKNVNNKELARRLSCSQANVSQLMAEDGNPTLETIARLFFALGDEPQVTSRAFEEFKAKENFGVTALANVERLLAAKTSLAGRPTEFDVSAWYREITAKETRQTGRKRREESREATESVAHVMHALQINYIKADRSLVSLNQNSGVRQTTRAIGVA